MRLCHLFLMLAAASLLALVGVSARGDEIILNTGLRYEGKIVEETEDEVVLKTRHGVMHISQDDIEEIIRKPTSWETYAGKAARLGKTDIDGHWKLAQWCRNKRSLGQEYRAELEKVLSLKPDHKEAKEAYAKLQGKHTNKSAKPDKPQAQGKTQSPSPSPAGTVAGRAKPPAGRKGAKVITLSPERKKKILDLIDAFFAEDWENVDARQRIIRRIDKLGPIPKEAVPEFQKLIFKKSKEELHGFKKVANKYQLKNPNCPGTFMLNTPGGSKKRPLFIGLHGGGAGSGDCAWAAQKWAIARSKGAITCFPQVIKKEDAAWCKEREEKYLVQLIHELKKALPVDTNRIYLAGFSMGGSGAWYIGERFADIFAAISPNAGGQRTTKFNPDTLTGVSKTIINLKATPTIFTHGANDRNVPASGDQAANKVLKHLKEKYGPYKFVYKEFKGGHAVPPGGFGPVVDWMLRNKRNPYPETIVYQPSRRYKKLFFWIKVDGNYAGQLVAKYDKSKNLVEIQSTLPGVSVFLNEQMADFNKPLRITLNGKTAYNDYLYYSASALLESIQDKKDRKQFFTTKVRVSR